MVKGVKCEDIFAFWSSGKIFLRQNTTIKSTRHRIVLLAHQNSSSPFTQKRFVGDNIHRFANS
jgi:hypothetical protein